VGRLDGVSVGEASPADVSAIVSLRAAAARELTVRHGRGHWSNSPTEAGVTRALKTSRVIVARHGDDVIGTVRVEARKPWAIDASYFSGVAKAVYLHDLAVAPHAQRAGIGRLLVERAQAVARAWPSAALRLDAYDHAAGAGPLYAACGFREVGRVTYRGVPLIYFELLL
jgi:GNAT superfamily N-acetyltransferase